MPGDKTYTTAAGTWPRCPKLTIESTLGTRIARLPLNFLETCGDNTWSYVSFVVSLLVIEDVEHPGSIINPETDRPVFPNEIPQAGVFRFIEQGKTSSKSLADLLLLGKKNEVTFARGPTSSSSVVPASGVEAQSISDRSRHSTDQVGSVFDEGTNSLQSDFREALLARDSMCLVSGNIYSDCQASHIVPWGRSDVSDLRSLSLVDHVLTHAGLRANRWRCGRNIQSEGGHPPRFAPSP